MHARDFVQRHCGVKGGGGGRAQEVMEAVEAHDIVLLCGETGCGKTTQVCPCLAALPRCVQIHAIAPELQLRLRQIQCTPRWIGRQSHRQVPWWLPYWADLLPGSHVSSACSTWSVGPLLVEPCLSPGPANVLWAYQV